ncbi:MAG: hypothetical protein ACJ0SL_00880 [Candidatus Rariloculaceae bacterium]
MNEKNKLELPEELREEDETSFTDTAVFRGEVTRRLDLLVEADKYNRQFGAGETEEPEAHGDTATVKLYSYVKKPVGLKKLLLDWLKN